jgi:copper transport protein
VDSPHLQTLRRAAGIITLMAFACLGGPVTAALAHANLTSTVPASGSSVAQSPKTIVMTFSENPDPKLSLVRVLDTNGHVVPGVSSVRPVPGKPLELQVALSTPLAKGVYTVNWRSVSAVDGHVANGAFAFGVGTTPSPGSVRTVDLLYTSRWTTGLSAIGRWLLYAGLAIFVGAAATSLLALGGRVPAGGNLALRVAAVVAVLGLCAMVWAERILVGAQSLLPLFETTEGLYLVALAVALVLCVIAVVCVDLWPARWSLLLLGALGAAAVLVHVLAGHADAPSSWRLLNVLVQWIHMTSVGVWIGGLAWLLLGIRGADKTERADAVAAFSRVATVTLVIVLATGLTRGMVEVRSLSNLVHTAYGITLVAKVAMVAGLVLLGALNHYRWTPLLRTKEGAARTFRLNSGGELAVAAAVLAATAVLSGLAPAWSVAAAGGTPATASGITVTGADFGTTVRVHLTVSPGAVGRNSYNVIVDGYDSGRPLSSVTGVTLQFSLPSQPSLSSSQLALGEVSGGTWRGSGLQLSVVGRWRVDVLVQGAAGGVTVPLQIDVAATP